MALNMQTRSFATIKATSSRVRVAAVPLGQVDCSLPVNTLVHTAAATELVSRLALNHMPKPFMVLSAPVNLKGAELLAKEKDPDRRTLVGQDFVRDQLERAEQKARQNTEGYGLLSKERDPDRRILDGQAKVRDAFEKAEQQARQNK